MTKPTIVVLEGLDGVGKSSTAVELQKQLYSNGYTACIVREPGFSRAGEEIRTILLGLKLNPLTQFFLFQAARVAMLEELKGLAYDYIILDRYWPSTLAYQCHGDGVSMVLFDKATDEVEKIRMQVGDVRIFMLMVPEAIRQQRIAESGKGKDQFESKDAAYFERVRQGYANLSTSPNITIISAEQPVDRVADYIMSALGIHG